MGESVQETEQCPVCSRQRGDLPLGRYYDGRACCRCRASLIVRRLIAFLIDYVAGLGLLGGAMIYATGASVIWLDVQGTLEVALLLGAWVVVFGGWLTKDGWFRGQSPGKWICGLRVVNADTAQPVSLLGSVARNLPLLFAPVLLIAALQVIAGNMRRWGEGVAGTKVVFARPRSP